MTKERRGGGGSEPKQDGRGYFTHYWKPETNIQHQGEPLDSIASNQFRQRGVEVGDIVYCVTLMQGQLHLVGRMEVGEIIDGPVKARKSAQSSDFVDRGNHCNARPGTGTEIRFDRVVPMETAVRLRLNGKPPKSDPARPGRLDTQTLRGIRRLDAASARILERVLEADSSPPPIIVAGGEKEDDAIMVEEGARVPVYHLRLERDPRIARQKKDEVQRLTGKLACECCEFDFAAFYGPIGESFAECHHRKWLSKTPAGKSRLTRTADLAIVCANCHRMLHKDEKLTVEKLRKQVDQRRKHVAVA